MVSTKWQTEAAITQRAQTRELMVTWNFDLNGQIQNKDIFMELGGKILHFEGGTPSFLEKNINIS